ncbi:MAG: GYF domain-containing protein, partial [Planctomycetes bacterium]|nr:GYF domain-containing protein [Planctomycetota bacterium]
ITLNKFLIENISVPQAVEEALDKRTQMGVLGDMNKYTQFQAANALGDAAKNPGAAGNMVGMLAGVNLGGVIGQNMQNSAAAGQQQQQQPQQAQPQSAGTMAGPPPLPGTAAWYTGIGGKQQGPFTLDEMAKKAADGEFSRDVLVWRQGMENWAKAGDTADLSGLFSSQPPPLPPPM